MTVNIGPQSEPMPLKLWVDDERQPPDGFAWVWTAPAAVELLKRGVVEELSLDHDLGFWGDTRPIVRWMCENDVWPRVVRVHTANPVGRTYLEGMIRRYGPPGVLHRWSS